MASLYITELTDGAGALQAAQLPALNAQKLTISATHAQSTAFKTGTKLIRLHTDTVCHILVGDDPTATTANLRMAADTTEYFGVKAGQKLSVIATS